MAVKKWIGIMVVVSAVLLLLVNGSELFRAGIRLWTGDVARWEGMSIRIGEDFLFLPPHDGPPTIVKYAPGKDVPGDDMLWFVKADASTQHEFEQMLAWCHRRPRTCRIRTDAIERERLQCVEVHLRHPAWGKGEFHARCRLSSGDIEIRYTGSESAYAEFYSIIPPALRSRGQHE